MRLLLPVAACVATTLGSTGLENHLTGFQGCTPRQEGDILTAWKEAGAIMDLLRDIEIDWNGPAAKDFLGPPARNQKQRSAIQGILRNLGSLTGSETPNMKVSKNWEVNVRCDDSSDKCHSPIMFVSSDRKPTAYVTSPRWIFKQSATINFCPSFFNLASLNDTIKTGKSSRTPQLTRLDLDSYFSAAYAIIHELLHIDWVHKSWVFGANQPVNDLVIKYPESKYGLLSDAEYKESRVYGSRLAKILARYDNEATVGQFVAQSDDNLGLFALATYVQQQIGTYPLFPSVDTKPCMAPYEGQIYGTTKGEL